MAGLTAQNRTLVFAEVHKQPYATRFAKEEIDQALASAVDIFSNVEQAFAPGFCAVLLRSAGGSETGGLRTGTDSRTGLRSSFLWRLTPEGAQGEAKESTANA